MSEATHDDEYDPKIFAMLELVWGAGFLSPSGPATVDAAYTHMKGPLSAQVEVIFTFKARDHFVENRRAITVMLPGGEPHTGRFRARRLAA